MATVTPSPRLRASPFYEQTVAAGAAGFTTYNQMLMPTGYGDPEGEYWRLIKGVSMWDVACERQVRLKGPDAARLAQILAVRDLSAMAIGQGKYVAVCNHRGVLLNDPVLLKLTDDEFWLSIADSNILFWADAIAAERGLEVAVDEPDVSPLAVQGPKAEAVVAAIFGDWVKELRYFWFREAEVQGIPVLVARSGYSKQGGFELYLRDGAKAAALWHLVAEAGRPFGIAPGTPNHPERIESGLISYGGDTDDRTTPFEAGMGRYLDLDLPEEVIGVRALRRIREEGPPRQTLGLFIDHPEPIPPQIRWSPIFKEVRLVGHLTSNVWSWRLVRNIGVCLVESALNVGEAVRVGIEGRSFDGALAARPFL
jgi:aminomethyltransferase